MCKYSMSLRFRAENEQQFSKRLHEQGERGTQ